MTQLKTFCVSVCVCLCGLNTFLNHAIQQDRALYEGVNASGEGHCQRSNFFDRNLQSLKATATTFKPI